MSAPDTDPKKEEKKHRFPLLGMGGVVLFAILLLVVVTVYLAYSAGPPGEASEEVDDFTGDVEEQTPVGDLDEAPGSVPAGSDASNLVEDQGSVKSDDAEQGEGRASESPGN